MNTKEMTTEHNTAHSAPKKIRLEFEPATLWKISTLVFAVLFVIAIFTGGFGYGSSKITGNAQIQIPTNAQPNDNNQPQPVVKADLKEEDDPCEGDKSAPVAIFEFTDYQCPFCERAYTQTYPEIQKLVKEGKVRFCLKDFPLPFHEHAAEGSAAANCAGQQGKYWEGKYWEMHDKLFSNQQAWTASNTKDTLIGYAKDLKLDEKKFASCLTDDKVAKEIQNDITEGSNAGVSGTPTFYINGKQVVGAQPWAAFKQLIDTELSK